MEDAKILHPRKSVFTYFFFLPSNMKKFKLILFLEQSLSINSRHISCRSNLDHKTWNNAAHGTLYDRNCCLQACGNCKEAYIYDLGKKRKKSLTQPVVSGETTAEQRQREREREKESKLLANCSVLVVTQTWREQLFLFRTSKQT